MGIGTIDAAGSGRLLRWSMDGTGIPQAEAESNAVVGCMVSRTNGERHSGSAHVTSSIPAGQRLLSDRIPLLTMSRAGRDERTMLPFSRSKRKFPDKSPGRVLIWES